VRAAEIVPIIIIMATAITGMILALWHNVRVLRRRFSHWQSNLSVLFIFSIGNGSADPAKIALWTNVGFSGAEAKMIIRRQVMCLLATVMGVVVGCVLSMLFVR
jgi:hypothetical protein